MKYKEAEKNMDAGIVITQLRSVRVILYISKKLISYYESMYIDSAHIQYTYTYKRINEL